MARKDLKSERNQLQAAIESRIADRAAAGEDQSTVTVADEADRDDAEDLALEPTPMCAEVNAKADDAAEAAEADNTEATDGSAAAPSARATTGDDKPAETPMSGKGWYIVSTDGLGNRYRVSRHGPRTDVQLTFRHMNLERRTADFTGRADPILDGPGRPRHLEPGRQRQHGTAASVFVNLLLKP
jgi:hypothetical protein